MRRNIFKNMGMSKKNHWSKYNEGNEWNGERNHLQFQIEFLSGVDVALAEVADDAVGVDETRRRRQRSRRRRRQPAGAVEVAGRDAALQLGRVDETAAVHRHLGAVLAVDVAQPAAGHLGARHLRRSFYRIQRKNKRKTRWNNRYAIKTASANEINPSKQCKRELGKTQ